MCVSSEGPLQLCAPHGENIDSMISSQTTFHFCVDNTVPLLKVECFSNNKPWISPEINALHKENKRAFRSGNKEEELRRKKTPTGRRRRTNCCRITSVGFGRGRKNFRSQSSQTQYVRTQGCVSDGLVCCTGALQERCWDPLHCRLLHQAAIYKRFPMTLS